MRLVETVKTPRLYNYNLCESDKRVSTQLARENVELLYSDEIPKTFTLLLFQRRFVVRVFSNTGINAKFVISKNEPRAKCFVFKKCERGWPKTRMDNYYSIDRLFYKVCRAAETIFSSTHLPVCLSSRLCISTTPSAWLGPASPWTLSAWFPVTTSSILSNRTLHKSLRGANPRWIAKCPARINIDQNVDTWIVDRSPKIFSNVVVLQLKILRSHYTPKLKNSNLWKSL